MDLCCRGNLGAMQCTYNFPKHSDFLTPFPFVTVALTQQISSLICFWGTQSPFHLRNSYVRGPLGISVLSTSHKKVTLDACLHWILFVIVLHLKQQIDAFFLSTLELGFQILETDCNGIWAFYLSELRGFCWRSGI